MLVTGTSIPERRIPKRPLDISDSVGGCLRGSLTGNTQKRVEGSSEVRRMKPGRRPTSFLRRRANPPKHPGGFLEFQATHPSLCESKTTSSTGSAGYKCPPLTSMSQPCLPVSNVGPTKILPFLFLGSQHDALSQETCEANGINYILNVSTTCPKPAHIKEGHFLRIPVNDNYSDKLLPYFHDAFQFLDKVREANGLVLVHCLAGISRSPTLAIAFIMRHLNMSSDDAYRYVKDKRPTISPNFNFLGQLLEYEKQRAENADNSDQAEVATHKRQCIVELRSPTSPTVATPRFVFRPPGDSAVQSPTTALAKLNFSQPSSSEKAVTPEAELPFPHIPTTSLDTLSFTPCFAKEDSPRALVQKAVATKRPLSSSVVEGKPRERSKSVYAEASTAAVPAAAVTLRSPEMKAKRPLVRPNSIAFSSYPMFDIPSESPDASCTRAPDTLMEHVSPARPKGLSLKPSVPQLPPKEQKPSCPEGPTKNVQRPVQMRPKTSTPGQAGRPSHLETGRKSRSLEDILKAAEGMEDCLQCVGNPTKSLHRPIVAAELFPQAAGLDALGCRCCGDPHQSSSSISSSGSHNSLHGSLEVIQVS